MTAAWLAIIGTVLSIVLIVLQQVFSSKRENAKKAADALATKEQATRDQATQERAEAIRAAEERDRLVVGESEFDNAIKHPTQKE